MAEGESSGTVDTTPKVFKVGPEFGPTGISLQNTFCLNLNESADDLPPIIDEDDIEPESQENILNESSDFDRC